MCLCCVCVGSGGGRVAGWVGGVGVRGGLASTPCPVAGFGLGIWSGPAVVVVVGGCCRPSWVFGRVACNVGSCWSAKIVVWPDEVGSGLPVLGGREPSVRSSCRPPIGWYWRRRSVPCFAVSCGVQRQTRSFGVSCQVVVGPILRGCRAAVVLVSPVASRDGSCLLARVSTSVIFLASWPSRRV